MVLAGLLVLDGMRIRRVRELAAVDGHWTPHAGPVAATLLTMMALGDLTVRQHYPWWGWCSLRWATMSGDSAARMRKCHPVGSRVVVDAGVVCELCGLPAIGGFLTAMVSYAAAPRPGVRGESPLTARVVLGA